MKYFGIGIVVIGLVVLGIWLKKAPASVPTQEQPALQTPQPQEQTTQPQKTSNRIINIKGMKIEITKEGTGEAVKTGQTATVDYVGKFADGTVFDASKKHGDTGFSFTLGAGQVIKGWDEGVVGMKVGEVRMLTIPPELAYGPQGYPGAIPPNATLTFEVTLLGFK